MQRGPKYVKLGTVHQSQKGQDPEFDFWGKNGSGWAAGKYFRYARPDLITLELGLWCGIDPLPEDRLTPFCSYSLRFLCLQLLALDCFGIVDCSKFSSLPHSLVKLQIGSLACSQPEPQSIDCSNRLCALEELSVKFWQFDDAGIPFNVTGNLSLAKLKCLTFDAESESTESGPVVLTELSCNEVATLSCP